MKIPHQQYVLTFNSLPEVIRSYIVDDSIVPIVTDIGKKYSFHVDVVGQLSQGATYMLMGLISPAELLGELVMADIDTGVAKSVLAELNQRVFIPLQEEVRKATSESKDESADKEKPPASVAPASPEAAPIAAQAAPTEPAPIPLPSAVQTPSEIPTPVKASAPAPQPAPSPIPPPAPPIYRNSAPQPVQAAPYPPEIQHARTMAGDMEMAAEGLRPGSAMPARSFQTASVPVTSSSPQPVAAPPPVSYGPIAPLPQSTRPRSPLASEYGSDPYREPVS